MTPTLRRHALTGAWKGLRNPLALVAGGAGSVFVGDWGTGIIYRITARAR